MPYCPPPELSTLDIADIADLLAKRALPPVTEWDPAHIGESRMHIDAQGRWFHQGGPITRPAMVRAFSSLLRREVEEDGAAQFWLVTPFEKQRIIVEDAPFIAVEMAVKGHDDDQNIVFRLNTDDLVIADAEHPITFFDLEGEPRAYCMVRNGLLARINRPTFYALVDHALERAGDPLSVRSNGADFPLVENAS